jgi:chromosome partitioning protein
MTARIVAVTNQKGGSGKTTTSMTLAAGLALRGVPTLVVDADQQGSALRWSTATEEGYPATVINLAASGKLASALRDHLENYEVIVIDCPPSIDAPVTGAALVAANLALIPVTPAGIDTWATEQILAKIEAARGMNPDLVAKVLLSKVLNTTVAAAVAEDMRADDRLDVLPLQISHRVSYVESSTLGKSIYATGDDRAIDECNALVAEVIRLLDLKPRHRAPRNEARRPRR